MPSRAGAWTRRDFVRGAAGVMAFGRLPLAVFMDTPRVKAAYVAARNSVDVFAVAGDQWKLSQRIAVANPAFVLLSANQQTLYVCNEVDTFQNLPCGTVQAFRVNGHDGRLELLGCTPLSLSATRPRHMALSPNGKLLAVAAYGGGIYNLLPIAADGSLGRPNGVFKALGSNPLQASAHPQTLCFDSTGNRMMATDSGNNLLTAFSVEQGRLLKQTQHSTGESSGLGGCVLHPSQRFLYAQHGLESALVSYRYDPATSQIEGPMQRLRFASLSALALDASGRVLFTGHTGPNELKRWRVAGNGILTLAQTFRLANAAPSRITLHGDSVYLLDGEKGAIYKMDAGSAGPGKVAPVDQPKSLAFKTT